MTGAAGASRHAAAFGAAGLLLVYSLTLAPDVTFWDSGEFIAAADSLGIPHPPGTPLYVLLLHVWARVFFFLPFAVATNLFPAVCTAAAAGLVGRLTHRATGSWQMALASTVAAGSMSSVWINATETEVYAASLLLGTLMVWAGERAGRENGDRFVVLLAYLIVMAVPLHLSALVAAPAGIWLAARGADGISVRRAALLAGALVLAVGVGRMSPAFIGAGVALVLGSIAATRAQRWGSAGTAMWTLLVCSVAASALLYLLVRAALDPAINQGNPATWQSFVEVVARRQYAVAPLFPRQAPLWLQVANFGQYADWQAALSLGPTVMPSILRTAGTLLFVILGVEGALHHFRSDRRTASAVLVLFLCGSLGVVAYLNMRAGPSIGWGILPETVMREARERDYFFVFAFWAWGMWAGMGAILMARAWKRPAWTGLLLAAIPVALNWRAVTRRAEPERAVPRAVAEAMLGAVPPNGVLLVAGDNDSYPLWYAQQVLGVRRDVAVVTIPLLPTRWYRAEMARRHMLLTDTQVTAYERQFGTVNRLVENARAQGRPVAASITLLAEERQRVAPEWRAVGLTYVEGSVGIDTAAASRWARWVAERVPRRETRASVDPVHAHFRAVLECPGQLSTFAASGDSTALDSVCNYR